MRLPIYFLTAAMFFACNQAPKVDNDKDSAVVTEIPAPEGPKLLASGEDYMIEIVTKDSMLLYGMTYTCTMKEVYEKARIGFPTINAQIKNHLGQIAGPLTIAYKQPAKDGKVEVLAGVPVEKSFQVEVGSFLSVPTKAYYRMQCAAGMGETEKWHLKMRETMASMHFTTGYPILEIFSETRNSNMAPETKATLLYPKP